MKSTPRADEMALPSVVLPPPRTPTRAMRWLFSDLENLPPATRDSTAQPNTRDRRYKIPTETFPSPASNFARYRSETPEFSLRVRRDSPLARRRDLTWKPMRRVNSTNAGSRSWVLTAMRQAPGTLPRLRECGILSDDALKPWNCDILWLVTS